MRLHEQGDEFAFKYDIYQSFSGIADIELSSSLSADSFYGALECLEAVVQALLVLLRPIVLMGAKELRICAFIHRIG